MKVTHYERRIDAGTACRAGDDSAGALPLPLEGELLHLDLLRFVASVGIVLCHSLEFLAAPLDRAAWNERLGYLPLFVDTFFVISGFVIARLYADRMHGPRDYVRFLQRRIARLVPLHLVVLIAWVALYTGLAVAHLPTEHAVSLSPGCVAVSAMLLTNIVPCGGVPPGGINWSIAAEMVMYLFFPVFLALVGTRVWRGLLTTAILFVVVWALKGGADIFWQSNLTVGRAAPAFALGVTLYAGRRFLRPVPGARVGLFVLAGALLSSMVWLPPNGVAIAIAYAMPAFAIAADLQAPPPRLVRRWAPLGQLTYAIYLLHGLVIAVLLNGIGDKLLHLGPIAMIPLAGLSFVVIFIAARLSLALLETPARRWINGLSVGSGAVRAGAGANG